MSAPDAGRELDAQVAEKVMGEACGFTFTCPSCGGLHFGSSGPEHSNIECHDELGCGCRWTGPRNTVCFPHERYSTEIAAAWLVVEEMARRGWIVDVQNRAVVMWACHVHFPAPDYRKVFESEGTAPLAICRAALKAAVNQVEA